MARKNDCVDFVPMTVYDVLRDVFPDVYGDLSWVLENSKTMSPYSFFDAFFCNAFFEAKKWV